MRYRFVLTREAESLVLSVAPLPEDARRLPPPENIVSLQIVEDWLPSEYFYSRLREYFAGADAEHRGTTLRIAWSEDKRGADETTTLLNKIASPNRFGRVGQNYVDIIGATPLVRVERLHR